MNNLPEPSPTDARLYPAIAAAHNWQMFDVTQPTQVQTFDALGITPEAIARKGAVEVVEDGHQYLFIPKPNPDAPDIDTLTDYPGAYACLEVAKLRPGEVLAKYMAKSPNFIFFTRLIIDQSVAVTLGSANFPGRDPKDEAWLQPDTAATAFARSFRVLLAEEYAAEMRRSQL